MIFKICYLYSVLGRLFYRSGFDFLDLDPDFFANPDPD